MTWLGPHVVFNLSFTCDAQMCGRSKRLKIYFTLLADNAYCGVYSCQVTFFSFTKNVLHHKTGIGFCFQKLEGAVFS